MLTNTDAPDASGTRAETLHGEMVASVPLIEESAHVSKTTVDQGGYRLHKHIESRVETVHEMLRREDVDVERRPVGRQLPVGEVPEPHYEGETFVIPVLREVLVTEKRLLLVEEVRLTTRHRHEPYSQSVTLRREEISIEPIGPDTPADGFIAEQHAPGTTPGPIGPLQGRNDS